MYIYKCPNEVKLQGGPNYFLSVRGCKGFFVLREFSGALIKCNTNSLKLKSLVKVYCTVLHFLGGFRFPSQW